MTDHDFEHRLAALFDAPMAGSGPDPARAVLDRLTCRDRLRGRVLSGALMLGLGIALVAMAESFQMPAEVRSTPAGLGQWAVLVFGLAFLTLVGARAVQDA